MSRALVRIDRSRSTPSPLGNQATGFDFSDLRIFTSIPRYHHDVAAMHGIVVVYDTDCISREGIKTGGLYIRESQRPPAAMPWEEWLKHEWNDREHRHSPYSRLTTRREVVQAVEHPHAGKMALRMATGGIDGPYHDWAFGLDLIGKVVGIYLSEGAKSPPDLS